MGFNGMFSDPHCRYTRPTGGYDFNQIGGHGFQWDVLRFLLWVYRAYMWIFFQSSWWTWVSMGCSQILAVDIQGLLVDLGLIRFVDMGFNGMFSDPH